MGGGEQYYVSQTITEQMVDDFFEVELVNKNARLTFVEVADVYDKVYKELKGKNISVFKVRIPQEEELMGNAVPGKGSDLFYGYGPRVFWHACYEKAVRENLSKFTRYNYEDMKKDFLRGISNGNELKFTEQKRLYIVGPCIVTGGMDPAEECFIPVLERLLRKYSIDKEYAIEIIGTSHYSMDGIGRIYETDLHENDVVIFLDDFLKNLSSDDLDLTEAFNQYQGENWLYRDVPIHSTVYGNELIAEEIINKIIIRRIKNTLSHTKGVICHKSEVYLCERDEEQLVQYLKSIEEMGADTHTDNIGCIVMNANPFTKGHRYLVEIAAMQVDLLYVFVVEEDKSFFSFKERWKWFVQGVVILKM